MFHLLRNNRGELDLGGKTEFTAVEVQELIAKNSGTLDQSKIDSIVTDRLSRQAKQFGDYDELKKFKSEHEATLAANEQKDLEAKGQYEKALETNNAKIQELSGVISQKDQAINSMHIGSALTNEIIAQGGFLEETLAMLKGNTEIKDGVVTIKIKDANGLDQSISVADGVKSFLEGRPHLVRATAPAGGAGTGGGIPPTGGGEGEVTLTSLNDLLMKQTYSNDFKGMAETKAKINAQMIKEGKTISSGVA